jgi:DNA-binding transcriptional MerR regulator
MKTRSAQDSVQETYPIRTVCALTGINPITLRAWERRYGLIRPIRTPGGHRQYTREHIDQIHRALSMVERGVPIGSAARTLRRSAAPTEPADAWTALLSQIVAAVTRFDEPALDATYESALALQPIEAVTRKLLMPVLSELGQRWESAEGGVAEEHFFATYMRNKLGARLHHRHRLSGEYKLLCACAPGELHEIGLLLFALAAHDHKIGCVLLGADMPLQELPSACTRASCDGIVISTSTGLDQSWLQEDLPKMVAKAHKPVFVGGQASAAQGDAIARASAIAIGGDIGRGLRRIKSLLSEPALR